MGVFCVVCPPPTASGHWSKEHRYHWCTRIGHSRIFTLYIFDFMCLRHGFKRILASKLAALLAFNCEWRAASKIQSNRAKGALNPNVISIRIREWPIRVHLWYPCSLDQYTLAVGGVYTGEEGYYYLLSHRLIVPRETAQLKPLSFKALTGCTGKT